MEQLNAAIATMGKEPGLELGAALIKSGIVTKAQVDEVSSMAGKVAVSCAGCRHEQEVNARVLKGGIACPKCGKPMAPGKLPPVPPPPPVPATTSAQRPNRLPYIIAGVMGSLALVMGIAALVRPSPKPEPVVEKPKPKPKPAPVETIQTKIDALLAREKADPRQCRTLHRAWTALLAESDGRADDFIRSKLEETERRANEFYRAAYRAVKMEVRNLVGQHKPQEAQQRLAEWKAPEELDIDGTREKERAGELAAIEELIALENARAAAGADPDAALKRFLESEHLVVRTEAQLILGELKAAKATDQIREKLASRRAAALARVEAARRQIAADARIESARMARWEKRLVEESAKKPWTLKSLGVDLPDSVSVKKFNAAHVVLGGGGIEFAWGIDAIRTELFGEMLVLACDPGNGRDLMEAGKWAVRRGAMSAAGTLFGLALKADPKLAESMPDLARISRGIASLRGDVALSGDNLSITYTFRPAEQVNDFTTLSGKATAGSRGITFSGAGFFYAVLKEMQFAGRVRIRATTGTAEAESGYVLGILVDADSSDPDQILLLVQATGVWRIFRRAGQQEVELSRGQVNSPGTLELAIEGTRVSVGLAGTTVWTGSVERFERVQALIGGADFSGRGGSASFTTVRIDGRASPDWVQRLHSERATVLESELAKDAKLTKEEMAASPVSVRDFASSPAAPLAIETEIGSAIPATVIERLRAVRAIGARITSSKSAEEYDQRVYEGRELLDQAVGEAPWLAPLLYYRAEWRHQYEGDRDGAFADLTAAVKAQPQLVEARLALATLLMARNRTADAEREIAEALHAVPDLSAARLLHGRLLYYAGKTKEALEEIELAWRLSPADLSMRRAAKRLKNAVSGPIWTASELVESEHYRIIAEVPVAASKGERDRIAKGVKAKAVSYAERLEATRKWFAELVPGNRTRAEKPAMFIFATSEGYYVYADFSLANRMEHSVGCYVPEVRQLLFFEDSSAADTIETMTHESFHEYLDGLVSGAPPWLNEGMAEYAACAKVEAGRVTGVGVLPGRLAQLQGVLKRGDAVLTFAQIMRESPQQFYGIAPQLQYAQAWSMIHFLRHFEEGKYQPVLGKYLGLLVDGTSGDEAYEETFAREDLKQLQDQWKNYVMGLR